MPTRDSSASSQGARAGRIGSVSTAMKRTPRLTNCGFDHVLTGRWSKKSPIDFRLWGITSSIDRAPAKNAGLALEQAVIAAAHCIWGDSKIREQIRMCLGIPGKIVEITNPAQKLALVDVAGVKREVNVTCVVNEEHPLESCIGDWVLVHVGFAMSRIDEQEAAATLEVLNELGEVQAELAAMRGSGKT